MSSAGEKCAVAGAQTADCEILAVLNEPFVIGKGTIHIGASIGISIYPDHGRSLEVLLKKFDAAMYVAKKNRKTVTGCRGLKNRLYPS
ncbi:MAG: putative signal transduction protein with EAL and GGDEF domain [Motiliproteus sp.]